MVVTCVKCHEMVNISEQVEGSHQSVAREMYELETSVRGHKRVDISE